MASTSQTSRVRKHLRRHRSSWLRSVATRQPRVSTRSFAPLRACGPTGSTSGCVPTARRRAQPRPPPWRSFARSSTELGVAESVELGGPIPRTEIAALLAASHALVNNMRPGAPDKVVYEAAAACRPVIASNPLFDELLDDLQPPLRFPLDDVGGLAARITAVASLPPGARASIGATLRERVLERHSVDSWADAVVKLSTGSSSAAP